MVTKHYLLNLQHCNNTWKLSINIVLIFIITTDINYTAFKFPDFFDKYDYKLWLNSIKNHHMFI